MTATHFPQVISRTAEPTLTDDGKFISWVDEENPALTWTTPLTPSLLAKLTDCEKTDYFTALPFSTTAFIHNDKFAQVLDLTKELRS